MIIIVELTGCRWRRGGKTDDAFRAHGQAGTGDLLAALRLTWAINLIAMAANGLQSPV
jgi:hypothetical protein